MKIFRLPLLLVLSILTSTVNADTLGLYVGGGSWKHDPTGTFGTIGNDTLDVKSDLNYTDESDTYFYAAFEHFIPLIPNIRIEKATFNHTGETINLTGTGINLNFNNTLVSGNSSINIDTIDAIIYWSLLDNWINFDLGLNLRTLDADFSIDTEIISVSETIPMLYLSAQFDLPFSGLSIGADINTLSISDVTYQDIRLRAIYEIGLVGFEAGYKSTTIELDDVSNLNADLEFKGITIGAFLHF